MNFPFTLLFKLVFVFSLLGFTNAASLAKKVILAQELCVNLGGLDNMFSTSPSIGTETRAGWSLQSLKHIIIQAGSLLDKLTSEQMAAQYESKCCLRQYFVPVS